MKEIKELLWEVCKAPGSPGAEAAARDAVEQGFRRICPQAALETDALGNLTAFLGNREASRQILFDAHLDQVALVVTGISKEGFLRIAPCGGVDRRVLPGSPVDVYGRERVLGIVCCQPPHLAESKTDKVEPVEEMYIDLGMDEAAAKETVALGDRVLLHVEPRELLGNRVTAAGLDNRAGVAVLLRCAQLLHGKPLACGVTFLFSGREEIGCEGAKTSAYQVQADEAVVVDVSFARQPGVAAAKSGVLGGGPMVGVAPSLDRGIPQRLLALAESQGIAYQHEVMGGRTGTNADVIGITREGVRTALVSIPLRYMHTTAEVIDLQDAEHTARLLAAYVQEKGGELDG